MYSLNVPVPGAIERLAAELHPRLVGFDRIRERHTLVCKRFEADDPAPDRLFERARRALAGAPAVEARATGIDWFEAPVRGPGPVAYVAIESPGLHDLHRRLVAAFDPIPALEGDDYVPHVTLARGGSAERARDLATVEIEPIEWTVTELALHDARHGERVRTLSLPRRP
ncbi:2'-5' RNA ligase family protein [Halococcus saccharolyticus]|uniref:2'-5' RNA ligase family protein n=1 Tax=Halococcus saccharolyticus TaxID=62319 RepID=UPI0006782614|nr:2'-5' RNA ligase family protein [Halococcus saccharolyticus]